MSNNTYQVLPGSMEIDNGILRAGIHTGPSEWVIENLRYVEIETEKVQNKNAPLIEILSRAYDEKE